MYCNVGSISAPLRLVTALSILLGRIVTIQEKCSLSLNRPRASTHTHYQRTSTLQESLLSLILSSTLHSATRSTLLRRDLGKSPCLDFCTVKSVLSRQIWIFFRARVLIDFAPILTEIARLYKRPLDNFPNHS